MTTAAPKSNECTICSRPFSNKKSLKRHYDTVHKDVPKPFECPQCRKKFTHSTNLEHHQRSHNRVQQDKSSDGAGTSKTALTGEAGTAGNTEISTAAGVVGAKDGEQDTTFEQPDPTTTSADEIPSLSPSPQEPQATSTALAYRPRLSEDVTEKAQLKREADTHLEDDGVDISHERESDSKRRKQG